MQHQFASGGTDSFGLAVLDGSAGRVAHNLVARELDVNLPLPGQSTGSRPMRLVHNHHDPTSTANRVVSGDLHFEYFFEEESKRSLE